MDGVTNEAGVRVAGAENGSGTESGIGTEAGTENETETTGEIPRWLPPLTAAERRLWEAFPYGDTVEYLSGDSELDDPARAAEWDESRTIRAAVIAALALGARRPVRGRTAGVRIIGARVVGQIELRHGRIDVPLTLRRCRIEDTLRFDEAVTKSIDLTGSHTGRIMAEGAHVRGSLKLDDTPVKITDPFDCRPRTITRRSSEMPRSSGFLFPTIISSYPPGSESMSRSKASSFRSEGTWSAGPTSWTLPSGRLSSDNTPAGPR